MRRSGLFMFCAGLAVGAVGRAAYPKLKESLGPLAAAALAGAESAFQEACAEAARTVGEHAETVQDSMAGMTSGPSCNGSAAASAS